MKNLAKLILPIFLAVLVLSSCKEDPPKADFIYDIDVLTVTFTNLSVRANSYEWNFGDGNTSTEENPVHVYTDGGTFTVSLKAKGDGGTDTYEEDITLTKPAAIIDGIFTDWAEYNPIYSDPDAENGSLLEFKMTWDAAFLYFYVKGNANTGPVLQIYVDKDNNGGTGWDYWGAYDTPGFDYMTEYIVEDFGESTIGATLFSPDQEDWPWNTVVAENAVAQTSGYIDGTGTRTVEFAIARSLMPDLGTTIRVSVSNSDAEWGEAGALPAMWQDPPNTLAQITLD